jgi:hypothetical protein
MRRSRDRFPTTHTGSLPRPADLDQMIADKEIGRGDRHRGTAYGFGTFAGFYSVEPVSPG